MVLLLYLMVSLMSLLHLHRHACRAAAGPRPRCTRVTLTRYRLRCGCYSVSSVMFSCYMLVFKADSLYFTFNLSNYSLTPDVLHYW